MNKKYKNVANYDITTAPSDEVVAEMQKIVADGKIKETGLTDIIRGRLKRVLEETKNAKCSRNDDYLVEIAAKYMRDDLELPYLIVEIGFRQIKSFISNIMSRLQVERQDSEDYYQTAKAVIIEKLPEYDASKNRIPAYIVSYIKGEFFVKKNRESGVTTNTKYNSLITKYAINAKNALIADGNNNPSVNDITNYINEVTPMYKPVTPKQVENALSRLVIQVEVDDNISDDYYNPERSYIQRESAEELRTICANKEILVKTMYDIYYDYYINSDADVFKKELSIEYLKTEMEKRTGLSLSSERIRNIKERMRTELSNKGFGPNRSEKKKNTITFSNVTFTDDDMETLENDINAAFDDNDIDF